MCVLLCILNSELELEEDALLLIDQGYLLQGVSKKDNTSSKGAKPIVQRHMTCPIVAIKMAVMKIVKIVTTSRPLIRERKYELSHTYTLTTFWERKLLRLPEIRHVRAKLRRHNPQCILMPAPGENQRGREEHQLNNKAWPPPDAWRCHWRQSDCSSCGADCAHGDRQTYQRQEDQQSVTRSTLHWTSIFFAKNRPNNKRVSS